MTAVLETAQSQSSVDAAPEAVAVPSSFYDPDQLLPENSTRRYIAAACAPELIDAKEEVRLAKRIEAGLYAAHKLLYEEDMPTSLRDELTIIAIEGEEAKARMLGANTRLVVSWARRYAQGKGRNMELADLIQAGNVRLFRAVEKFDHTKGWKFSTYATTWIKEGITKAILREEKAQRQADGTDLVHLDATVGDGDETLGNIMSEAAVYDDTDRVALGADLARLFAAAGITPEEQQMFALHSGAVDGTPWTYAELAKRFGRTISQVKYLLPQVGQRLREAALQSGLDVYL